MDWLRNKNQADERSLANVTALVPASPENAPAPAPSPVTSPNRTSPSSFVVPVTAIVIALCAVIGAGANWDWWVASRAVQTTDDAAVYADVSSVSARVGGTVEAISVGDYARVKAGDLLFSIDRKPFEVALRAAKARLEAARAQLEDNDTQRTFQLTQIDVAVAEQQASAADEIQASKELERQTRLGLDGRASSVQTLEKATAAHERALANSKMTDATVLAQRVKLDVIAKQRNVLKANLDTAAADVAARELDLDYADVRAPVDGVVAKRNVQLGNYVATGTSLISIVPLPRIYILANYKENQLALVREGQRVDISVDLLPGERLHGTVSNISPATGSTFALLPPDNATGNFTKVAQRLTVRIELDPDQSNFDRLRPGMSVITRITTKAEHHV
ncbi:multidrug resistance efflux pump [Rhizobium sp. R72]|uniref:HlyD family secretion protein n=1 Tax=unclassified Rhizobium TaxID=2613769 RepID=UPI000B536016|nr:MULTISPECIES: HlyD family secretion protein [unclassified Rhizobium]OWV98904.1 multidrug resistance efflux pump [Rhizobium sp. R72]OWV98955.1 multidrug resistance efflux pump [Rhizobium sp. R711]